MCPGAVFEDIVDIYPQKQEIRKLSFSVEKISKILGVDIGVDEIENILKRYNFEYGEDSGIFKITVLPMRLDLVIEEDMAEEIGRILGYDKVKGVLSKINFTPKTNETSLKIVFARNKLLNDGYSEVMNTTFREKGEISVLASASDKTFLRTNLIDRLNESLKLNQNNISLLGLDQVKIFEIGTVFKKSGEEIHVAFGDKKGIKEMQLEEFTKTLVNNFEDGRFHPKDGGMSKNYSPRFKMWSLFPFIARDMAVWVPENITNKSVADVIKNNMGEMVVRGPELFDEFKKDGKISYAFRLVFQAYDRTLTDQEVNNILTKITDKITENKDWQVR
jgi:phenylalanyl-tRNA synthetase beta subunit